jgi:quinol monooxygenase YgiN
MAEKHVSMAVIFDVPEGKDFRSKFGGMYEKVKAGTSECLYYGFAVCGNKVLCREGYSSVKGLMEHGKDVKAEFQAIESEVGSDKIRFLVTGTGSDLTALNPHLGPKGARMVELDSGAIAPAPMPKGCKDTHITILVEFVVQDGKLEEFKAGFSKFYNATKSGGGADGCLYYSFGVEGNSVFCREGYTDAAAIAKHGEDIKGMLDEPLKVVGEGGMKLNVVGPKAEIDKLRERLEPRGAVFWELDDGALWR